jgi:hypothetical protein
MNQMNPTPHRMTVKMAVMDRPIHRHLKIQISLQFQFAGADRGWSNEA